MVHSDFDLATMLLDYLRKWVRSEPQYKYNIIGRGDLHGVLEMNLHIVLSLEERASLLWIWSQFEHARLLTPAHGDGWATLSKRGGEVSEMELRQIISTTGRSPLPNTRIDPLLGIADRGEYDKRVSELIGQADLNNPLSLVVIDLDHFKSFNDKYGHQVGDSVLKATATAVGQVAAQKGEAFRYGGEELVVLLPNHSIVEAKGVAERIRVAITALEIANVDTVVTASLGISTFPCIASSLDELFREADAAMYRSKQGGRNAVTCAGQIKTAANSHNARALTCSSSPRAIISCHAASVLIFPTVFNCEWGAVIGISFSAETDDDEAAFDRMHSGSEAYVVAFRFQVAVATLSSIVRKMADGKTIYELRFTPVRQTFESGYEVGIGGLTAEELATMRAERILLDKHVVQRSETASAIDKANRAMVEAGIQGVNSPVKAERSQFVLLWPELKDDTQIYLEIAWIVAVRDLKLSATVEHINRLILKLTAKTLSVEFSGTRHRKYVNEEPLNIEVNGELELQ